MRATLDHGVQASWTVLVQEELTHLQEGPCIKSTEPLQPPPNTGCFSEVAMLPPLCDIMLPLALAHRLTLQGPPAPSSVTPAVHEFCH